MEDPVTRDYSAFQQQWVESSCEASGATMNSTGTLAASVVRSAGSVLPSIDSRLQPDQRPL